MHSLSIFTIFHEKFYIGICSNQCPCYELKWTSSNWMKIDEKISSNWKSIKRVRKLPQKLFEPVVMYCISLTGYESKCFHTGQDSIKMHLKFVQTKLIFQQKHVFSTWNGLTNGWSHVYKMINLVWTNFSVQRALSSETTFQFFL